MKLLKLDLIRAENIEYYYVYFPEIFSILLGIMLLNYINFKNKVLNSWVLVKFTSGIFSFIGKVSYSGYLLSMFVLDFYLKNSTSLTVPRGWLGFFLDFGLYACLLVLVSTITYYSVELPFLKYRKRY